MRKFTLGFVPVGSLVVLLLVVGGLGVGLVALQRQTGFLNLASSGEWSGRGDPSRIPWWRLERRWRDDTNRNPPARQAAELGLKIVPTLANDLGKANVHAEWAAISDSKFDHFTLQIGGEKETTVNGTSKDFSNLPFTNGNYTARLQAFFKNDTIKFQDVQVGYFEDGFGGGNINNSRWTKVVDSGGSLEVSSGAIKTGIQGQNTDGGTALVYNEELHKPFAASVEYSNFSANSKSFAGARLKFDTGNASAYKSTEVIRVSSAGPGGIRWWAFGDPGERAAISANVNQGRLELLRSNDNSFREFYDIGSGWNEMTPASPVVIDTNNSQGHIYFGIWSGDQHPAVSASFDNFRLVWVK